MKNAYDADSRDVNIAIIKNNDDITISVIDHGHGMSSRDIAEKWLVPSTENKKNNRKSPSGRIMQGRKGIGRYAASILGNSFVMKTSTADGIENTVSINWSEFAEVQYLDQVKINVVSEKTDKDPGTSIVIVSNGEESAYWNEKKIDKLKFELKKLIAPKEIMGQLDKFDIVLTVEGFGDIDIKEEKLEAFPIMQFYDYRISGTINSDGKGCLKYETQKIQNAIVETIELDMNEETGCGDLSFDIRVYDRDLMLCAIEAVPTGLGKSKLSEIVKNKKEFYHWLPDNSMFDGGIINFRRVVTVSSDKFFDKFDSRGIKVQDTFVKNIMNRFSAYYARQGQPDFAFDKEIENRINNK